MSRYFGNEDEHAAEMRKGRQRAEELQRKYDEEGNRSYEASRRASNAVIPRRSLAGEWRFIDLLTASGQLVGWRVELENRIVGMLMIRGNDLVVMASGDEYDLNSPTPHQIMEAFMLLVGAHKRTGLNLPRGQQQLPSGSEFGPSRNWDEE